MQKSFKLGIDLHGVIDHNPMFFSALTHMLKDTSEIHIISGGTLAELKEKLKRFEIHYDEVFSIPDYLIFNNVDYQYDSKGNFRVDEYIWDSAKGKYCEKNGINVMIDDSIEYKKYMPKDTFFYHYTFQLDTNRLMNDIIVP